LASAAEPGAGGVGGPVGDAGGDHSRGHRPDPDPVEGGYGQRTVLIAPGELAEPYADHQDQGRRRRRTPKPSRVKHVFVITLSSPGYDAAFGAQSQMPYLAKHAPSARRAAGATYTLLTDKACPTTRHGRRPVAERADLRRLHHLHRVSGNAQPDDKGNVGR